MPEIGPYHYVIDMLLDVGPIDLTWSDLKSWNKITSIKANSWELKTLKRLADLYTSNSRKYSGSKDVPPFVQKTEGKKLDTNIKGSIRESLGKGMK